MCKGVDILGGYIIPFFSCDFHQPFFSRPYTPMRGSLSTVWFDRYKISNDCPEHIETIDSMCQDLTSLIDDEVKNGIRKNRILLGKI